MTRFEKLIQEMADVSLSWEYAGGDFIAPDATAHLAEIERLRSELAAERARAEIYKPAIAAGIALLFAQYEQDGIDTFTLEEVRAIKDYCLSFRDERLEHQLRAAWLAVAARESEGR